MKRLFPWLQLSRSSRLHVSTVIPGLAGTDPLVHLVLLKLPKASDLVRRHLLTIDPLVDRVAFDPEVGGNLVHGQPAVVHHLVHLASPVRNAHPALREHGMARIRTRVQYIPVHAAAS